MGMDRYEQREIIKENIGYEQLQREIPFDDVESLLFAKAKEEGMGVLAEEWQGETVPSRAFAEGGIHEAIENYEDVVFYEILAEELALRDMDGEPLTRENYGALMERIDTYLDEFDEHGTEHISIDLD